MTVIFQHRALLSKTCWIKSSLWEWINLAIIFNEWVSGSFQILFGIYNHLKKLLNKHQKRHFYKVTRIYCVEYQFFVSTRLIPTHFVTFDRKIFVQTKKWKGKIHIDTKCITPVNIQHLIESQESFEFYLT